MVWAATAIVGSAVVGAGVGIYSASKSSSTAARASDQQSVASTAQLAFQQQQYADWQAVYGPIQDNLSNFYQNLTPETLVASGLKNYEQQHVAVQQQLDRTFAQRGIDSPAQSFLAQNNSLRTAEAKATLRTDAPFKVAQAQQGFLDHQVVNPAGAGVANAYQNRVNFFGGQATQYNNQALAGYQAAGQAIQGGVSGYLQYQQYQSLQGQQVAPPVFAPPQQPAAPYYAVT